jgi:HNH endonuclease
MAHATDPIERFLSKVDPKPDGCWLWTAGRDRHGYGQFSVKRRKSGAHRWGYILLVGPISDDLTIDHLCRVRLCVNPDHLEPVTNVENIRRGLAGQHRRRTVTAEGYEVCRNGHLLTPENARPLRQRPHLVECRTCASDRRRRWDAA